MSGYRVDQGVPFLINDEGDLVGYVNDRGVERGGAFGGGTPGATPAASFANAAMAAGIGGMNPGSVGTLITDWSTSSGSLSLISANGGGEAIGLDTTKRCDGMPMLKVTMGNTGTYIADFTFTTPKPMAQMRSLEIPIQFTTNSGVFVNPNTCQIWFMTDLAGTTQQFRLGSTYDAPGANRLRAGVTHTISVLPGAANEGWNFAGTPLPVSTTELDPLLVYRIRIVIAVPASVNNVACWIGPLRMNGRRKGLVSLVLDGQYESQRDYILPMIESQGFRASMALVYSGIGGGGRFTEAQLGDAYLRGHEMIHHTFDGSKTNGYQNATDWPTQASIVNDITAGNNYLRARGWTRGIGCAVHAMSVNPYSNTVSQARQDIVTAAYRQAGLRVIRDGVGRGLNQLQSIAKVENIDAYCIQGAIQITNTHTAADVTNIINRAAALGQWAVITIHYSAITAPGGLTMLNSDFKTWLDALGTASNSGSVVVLPFGEAATMAGIGLQ